MPNPWKEFYPTATIIHKIDSYRDRAIMHSFITCPHLTSHREIPVPLGFVVRVGHHWQLRVDPGGLK